MTIIIALLIFTAETLRDVSSKDRARVLLMESFILPLALVEIFTLLSFIIFQSGNIFSAICVFAVGIGTAISLIKTVRVLLSQKLFIRKRTELLTDRLFQSLDIAITERIASNKLLSCLDGNPISLTYSPSFYFIDDWDDYYVFTSKKSGFVKDINLLALYEVTEAIEEYSLKSSILSDISGNLENTKISNYTNRSTSLTERQYQEERKIFLSISINQSIEEKTPLIVIDKSKFQTLEPYLINKIDARLNYRVFEIGDSPSFTDEVKSEFDDLRDQFIQAIRGSNKSAIDDFFETYTAIAERFILHLQERGVYYSLETALSERKAIFGSWNEVNWLVNGIREILDEAMKSKDKNIIETCMRLPVLIANRAIEAGDHYLFQEFIRFQHFIYSCSNDSKTDDTDDMKEIRKYLKNITVNFLKKTTSYYLMPKLKKYNTNIDDYSSVRDFGFFVLITSSGLLKEMLDARDFDTFSRFVTEIQNNFKFNDRYNSSYTRKQNLEIQIQSNSAGIHTKEKLEIKLDDLNKCHEALEELDMKKNELFFGLSSWGLFVLEEAFNSGDVNKQELFEFYKCVSYQVPSDPIILTNLFLKTQTYKTADFWGWARWEMIPDGQVHDIEILNKLVKFFCVKILTCFENMDEEKIKSISLPLNRELSFYSRADGGIIKILDEIKRNINDYEKIIGSNIANNIILFKNLLDKTQNNQKNSESSEIREKTISPNKVNEFKEYVVRKYYELVNLRDLFDHFDKIIKSIEKTDLSKERFGIVQADFKEAFFDDWHTNFRGWGEGYADSMASGEDTSLFSSIESSCTKKEPANIENIFRDTNWIKDAFIITSTTYPRELIELVDFSAEWQVNIKKLNVKGFQGWIKFNEFNIPVFGFQQRNPNNSPSNFRALLLDKNNFGQLVQKSPLGGDESEDDIIGRFFLSVKEYSEDKILLEKTLNDPPEWLREHGDREAQKLYLQERVLVKFIQRFEYIKPKNLTGIKFHFKKERIK